MKPKPPNQHDVDQAIAQLRDTFPRAWWGLFVGCTDAGFSPRQALDLVKTYILAQNPHGIQPPQSGQDQPDKGDFSG